jgi:hypothetical protein
VKRRRLANPLRVALEVADRRVDLGQNDAHGSCAGYTKCPDR